MDQAAGQVQPTTEKFTSEVLRPGGEEISKNAVPATKHVTQNTVQPVVEQVRSISLPSLTLLHTA